MSQINKLKLKLDVFSNSLDGGVVIIDGNNLRYSLYRDTPGTNHAFTGEYDKVIETKRLLVLGFDGLAVYFVIIQSYKHVHEYFSIVQLPTLCYCLVLQTCPRVLLYLFSYIMLLFSTTNMSNCPRVLLYTGQLHYVNVYYYKHAHEYFSILAIKLWNMFYLLF